MRSNPILDSGYYAACAGLAAQTQALEIVAHNLANLTTTGYRGEQTTFRSLLAGHALASGNPLNAVVNHYGVLSGSRLDLTAGSLVSTGNPTDVAIAGSGFFAVQSPQGVVYTRDGNFHVTPTGQLVTSQGDAVLGEQGALTLPGSGNGDLIQLPVERAERPGKHFGIALDRNQLHHPLGGTHVGTLEHALANTGLGRRPNSGSVLGVSYPPPQTARRTDCALERDHNR